MKSDFLSAPFLRLPKTITAILITKVDEEEVGTFRFLQYLSEILSTFSLNFGDRHLCLGRLKCQTNRLEKSQKLKWVSALQTPSHESDFYQPSIPLTFNPLSFQLRFCACLYLQDAELTAPHPVQLHVHA